jgi:alpha-tubulin suppressor-like RCC1 family protein
MVPPDWADVHRIAEELSSKYTETGGHRPLGSHRLGKALLLWSSLLLLTHDAGATKASVSGHTMILKDDGRLFASGPNGDGQLGVGDQFSRRVFCQPQGSSVWRSVVAGPRATFAIKTDDTLWSCGSTSSGLLGLGDFPSVNGRSFSQVGPDNDWAEVSIGERHGMGCKSTGSLWVWGYGPSGQLGLGSANSNQSAPFRLGTDSDWLKADAGISHNLAIKTDGSLWVWGLNFSGQLGIAATGNRNTPVNSVLVILRTDWNPFVLELPVIGNRSTRVRSTRQQSGQVVVPGYGARTRMGSSGCRPAIVWLLPLPR